MVEVETLHRGDVHHLVREEERDVQEEEEEDAVTVVARAAARRRLHAARLSDVLSRGLRGVAVLSHQIVRVRGEAEAGALTRARRDERRVRVRRRRRGRVHARDSARALSRRERRKRRPGTVRERANVLTRLGGVMRETTTRADAPVRDERRARRRARPGRTNEHPLPHFRRARDFVLEPVRTHPPTADGNENHAMHSRDCFRQTETRRRRDLREGTLRVGHRGYPTSARAVRRATSSTVTIWYTFRHYSRERFAAVRPRLRAPRRRRRRVR